MWRRFARRRTGRTGRTEVASYSIPDPRGPDQQLAGNFGYRTAFVGDGEVLQAGAIQDCVQLVDACDEFVLENARFARSDALAQAFRTCRETANKDVGGAGRVAKELEFGRSLHGTRYQESAHAQAGIIAANGLEVPVHRFVIECGRREMREA